MANVYVVEENLSVCLVIERALEGRGHSVHTESSGRLAVAHLGRTVPDLVICDLFLPDVSGFEVCTFLRGNPVTSTTPIVLMASVLDEDVERQARKVPVDAVLPKPLDPELLAGTVDGLLSASSPDEADWDETDIAFAVVDDDAPVAESTDLGTVQLDVDEGESTRPAPPEALERDSVEDEEEVEDEDEDESPPKDPRLAKIDDLLEVLSSRMNLRFAAVVDTDGAIVTTWGKHVRLPPTAARDVAYMSLQAAATSEQVGHGKLHSLILESVGGTLLLRTLPGSHTLVLAMGDITELGKGRYVVRRMEAELYEAIDHFTAEPPPEP